MGQPVGYPDWVRSFATSRFWDIPAFNTTVTQETVLSTKNTVNIDSLGVHCVAITGHGQIKLEWFFDEALTKFATLDVISIRQGATFNQSIVVKGAFLKITISNVEPADWTISLILYETTRSVIPYPTLGDNILISLNNVAVPVGGSTFSATRIVATEAVWVVRSALATWTALLQTFDHLGVTRGLDEMSQATPQNERRTYLPPVQANVFFNNSTAAAGTADIYLISRPGLSGM